MSFGKGFSGTIGAVLCAAGLLAAGLLGGCATTATPPSAADRAALAASVKGTLAAFTAKDPSLTPLLKKSVGWVIFPEIGKGAIGFGGSYGQGEVYERGRLAGYADVSEISFGLQLGAQSFAELLLFLRPEDLARFKRGDWALTGNASAVALTEGAAGSTDPAKGVLALIDAKGGLMAEAAIGGQRYQFQPVGAVPAASAPAADDGAAESAPAAAPPRSRSGTTTRRYPYP